MSGVLEFIQNHFPTLIDHKYIFLFLGSMIEGLSTFVVGGILASAGKVRILALFPLFILGHVLSGYFWYGVGYLIGSKGIDRWIKQSEKGSRALHKVEHYLDLYGGRAIVFVKLTFSVTIATMITLGSLKYDFKKFSLYSFIGSLGWVTLTVSAGFFLGASYKLIFANILKGLPYILVFLLSVSVLIYISHKLTRANFFQSWALRERFKHLSDRMKIGWDKFWVEFEKENPHDGNKKE